MSTPWLIILAALLLVALAFLVVALLKLRRQNILIRLQSIEIERQIRELVSQNHVQEELNREKKQLVSLVSHDMKGPFNRIFALTQLMEMTSSNFSEEQKECLGKIYQIVGDGLTMVRNLVDARKMEDHGFDLHPEKIDFTSTVVAIVNQYRIAAERKKIAVHFHCDEKIELTVDKNYLSRILENLLSNAIKFSSKDKNVNVTLKNSPDFVEIIVQDEGPGFSTDDQAQLYQKFKKLSARPTGGESSTGLGLSIVKQLVTTMGGSISCQSELKVGSTFTFRLPHTEVSKFYY